MHRNRWVWLIVPCIGGILFYSVWVDSAERPPATIPVAPEVCRDALGDLQRLPATIRYLFEPGDDDAPLDTPLPSDWLSKHEERGQSFEQFRTADRRRPTSIRNVIYLLPLGEFGELAPPVERLRQFTEAFFQIKTRLLPSLPIDPEEFGMRTNVHTEKTQVRSPMLLERVKQSLPRDACCLLGITMLDLYPDQEWNYVFGQASLTDRVGVFSFARFDPSFLDEPRPADLEQLVLRRSCRVLAHETAHMFGLHHCIYYQCVVNGANNRDEMDRTPLHPCPVCLRKLHMATGFDPLARYQQLAKLYREFGMETEAAWIDRRLRRKDK